MRKKRPLTEAEKKLNQIRSANRREGYFKAYDELRVKFATKIVEIEQQLTEEKRRLEIEAGVSIEEHEALCRQSRASGYETGLLVGAEKARAELREFYEKQRREYMVAHSPFAEPILSPWELFDSKNAIPARGDS